MARSSQLGSRGTNSRRSSGRGCLLAFFALFFGFGCLFLYILVVRPLIHSLDARDWVETPCTIISSQVERHAGDDGDTYSIAITYRYVYEGHEYTSGRYHFFEGSTSGRTSKEAVVRQYPPGRVATCFVDPDFPDDAVINRDLTSEMWWGLLPGVFVLVGGVGFVATWWRGTRALNAAAAGGGGRVRLQRSISSARLAATRTDDRGGNEDPDQDSKEDEDLEKIPTGPLVLQPSQTPTARFVGTLIITLVWNSILSFFVGGVVGGFQRGQPNILMTVIVTPFAIIGLLLIAGTIHAFLGLFNPRLTMVLERGLVILGEDILIRWSFTGNTRSLRQLLITLEGTEKATYRRGTTTHIDSQTFASLLLVDTTDPARMPSGTARLRMPVRTMHTFDSGHNQINWELRSRGTIAFWPDVAETFAIRVEPAVIAGATL